MISKVLRSATSLKKIEGCSRFVYFLTIIKWYLASKTSEVDSLESAWGRRGIRQPCSNCPAAQPWAHLAPLPYQAWAFGTVGTSPRPTAQGPRPMTRFWDVPKIYEGFGALETNVPKTSTPGWFAARNISKHQNANAWHCRLSFMHGA